jgi:methylase of polypeptide subunit release factors
MSTHTETISFTKEETDSILREWLAKHIPKFAEGRIIANPPYVPRYATVGQFNGFSVRIGDK